MEEGDGQKVERSQLNRGLLLAGTPVTKHLGTKMSPLANASMHGDVNRVKELLAQTDTDVNAVDEETMSALHWAASYGEGEIVKLFLADPRVDVHIKNKRGGTPLHQATLSGTHLVLQILTADKRVKLAIDEQNNWGETALILAATTGDATSALILLQNGANPALTDKWGKSAKEVALDHGEKATAQVIQDFIDGKEIIIPEKVVSPPPAASPTPKVTPPKRILSKMLEAPLNEEQALKWIADPSIDLNGADYYRWTALHKCAMWEKPTIVEALLAHPEVDPTRRGADGDTVLHAAVSSGGIRCTALLLKDGRVSPNTPNEKSSTPLMQAIETGDIELIKLLLSYSADPNVCTPEGKTAYNIAKELRVEDIASLLWEKMNEEGKAQASLFTEKSLKKAPATKIQPHKLSARLVEIQEEIRRKEN